MIEERIGYRYAKSIYDLAKEKNITAEVYADMIEVADTCKGNRELQTFLSSPIIHADKKQNVLHQLFASNMKSQLSMLMMDTVVRKGREMYLYGIAAAFIKLYDSDNRIERGEIISAAPMSESEVAEIRNIVQQKIGKSFVFEQVVNPDLIGGFVLKVGDKLFDGSVAASLRQIKQSFNDTSFVSKL